MHTPSFSLTRNLANTRLSTHTKACLHTIAFVLVSPLHRGSFSAPWRVFFRQVPGCVNYLDDVYVTGKNDEDHLRNLHKVLSICEEKGLSLRRDKCEFMQQEVTSLVTASIETASIRSRIKSRRFATHQHLATHKS